MARLIDADLAIAKVKDDGILGSGYSDSERIDDVCDMIDSCPTVDAVEVVHGWWKGYVHSALVRWKDGEPVWADRNVYRCSRCDFGTIAKHNYCPNCGAKMDGDGNGR